MKYLDIVRIPARLSRLGVTEIYYDYVDDDWHERAQSLQDRRWHKLRNAAKWTRSYRDYTKDLL